MGFQCVPQTIGLVRGTPKEGQKNRANGAGILAEMGEERYSNSTTIDHEKSWANKYYGEHSSGIETWVQMVEEADAYRSTYTDKNGTQRSRKLPAQSIIAVATIINPPEEATKNWSTSDHDRFQQDAEEVLAEIEPRIYSRKNRRLRADHFDEGYHAHYVHDTKDETGRYCGSVYDAKLRTRMAVEFAQKMRERGWEIDDPEMTDWNKYGELKEAEPYAENAFQLEKPQQGFRVDDWVTYANPDYREEIDAKRRKSGLSQPNFKAQKEHEERLSKLETQAREVEQQVAESNEWLDEANRQAYEAHQYAERMNKRAKKQEEFTNEAKRQATEYSKVAREKMLPEVERIQREANEEAAAIKAQAEEYAASMRSQVDDETLNLKEKVAARESAVSKRETAVANREQSLVTRERNLETQETELKRRRKKYGEDKESLDKEYKKLSDSHLDNLSELNGLRFLEQRRSFFDLWLILRLAVLNFLEKLGTDEQEVSTLRKVLYATDSTPHNRAGFEMEFLRAADQLSEDLSFGTSANQNPQPQKDDPQPGY